MTEPAERPDLTEQQLHWLTRALMERGFSWNQVTEALVPPYDSHEIETSMREAGAAGPELGKEGETFDELIVSNLISEAQERH